MEGWREVEREGWMDGGREGPVLLFNAEA